ncbi:MAG: glycogen synthase GlgA [Clostridiales bacterium]|nr:glycogen synthase GlgA [Clostridiales bacterium]
MPKVLFVSSEAYPFAKSGGLGEVAAALPKELVKQGADCRVVLPKYKDIPEDMLADLQVKKTFETTLAWRKLPADIYELERDGVTYYLLDNYFYFHRDGMYGYGDDHERFGFFSKAAVEMFGTVGFMPDIVHCNDWQTGLCPVYLRDKLRKFSYYRGVKSLFTIHNLQYQGVYGRHILGELELDDGYFSVGGMEFYGCVSLLKAGIAYADAVSTVSETYAREIQTPSYGFSMDGVIRSRSDTLFGIINGIDYEKNDPEKDKHIYVNYDKDTALENKVKNKIALQKDLGLPVKPDTPMFSIVSRLTDQKGFDLFPIVMDEFMYKDVQLVVLGQGEGRYEQMFNHCGWKYPDKSRIHIGFDDGLAQRIYAASDFFLMPSLFEPCGLGQMTAMRYGALPIVRKTGGLADTVKHFNPDDGTGNGFSFENYDAAGLMWGINEALGCYAHKDRLEKAIKNAMESNYSWKKSAQEYIKMYKKMLE